MSKIAKKQFANPPKRVGLFVTCMVDMIYPEVGMATVELLERNGVEVYFPPEQTCCGQPAFNSGYWDETRPLAQRHIEIFEPLVRKGQVEAIVAPSGSCVAMAANHYLDLFADPALAGWRARAEALAAVTFELTEFLVDVLGVSEVGAHFPGRLTYHACCHLNRELGVDRQPRALLEHVGGAELVELTGHDECCGFGGLFAVKNGPISTAMDQRKARNLAASGADVVALCDVSCMTQINGMLSRQAQRCRAVHIAQVLVNEIDVQPTSAAALPPAAEPPPRRWQDTR